MAYEDAEGAFALREKEPKDPSDMSVCRQTIEQINARVDLEQRARSRSAGSNERRLVTLETLFRLAYSWAHEVERGKGARLSIVGMVLSAVPLVIAATMLAISLPALTTSGIVSVAAIAGVGVLGLGAFVWHGLTRKGRVFRTYVLPRVAASLRPLQLTVHELAAFWPEASDPRDRWNIARRVTPEEVAAAVHEIEAVGLPWVAKAP